MQRRAGVIDVLADIRSLQDPLYAGRGIGSHAEFLLATLRDRGAGRLRIVGLVDPERPPPAAGVAASCHELRPVFAADPGSRSVFLCLSPMTHDTRPPARLLDRVGVRAAAVVYDFIPLEFPDRYLHSKPALYRYTAAAAWLPAYEAFFPISHHAAAELARRQGIAAARIDVTGVALREAFARRLGVGGARRPDAAADTSILFMGGPDERKNLDAAVAAFTALRAAGRTTLQLAVAGDYPQDWRERVRARCGSSAAGLVFLDRLSDEHLADWHAHARATVIASRAEGFSLPVVECIASGSVAVVSDIPVHRELVVDPGVRFEPEDHARLAAILGRVLDAPAERSRLAAAQHAVASRFTAQAVGDRFWDAFARRFLPATASRPTPRPRRRSIAFVTPFPPDRTGVADYSLRCVEALARDVDVDVYTDQPAPMATAAVRQFHPITAAAWLRPDYDATIAVVGNSSFHTRIIELHRRFGGPCIVHDNRLAELTAWWKGAEHLRTLAERTLGRGVRAEEVSSWLADPGGLPTLFYDEILDTARPLLVHSRGIQEHVGRLYHAPAHYLPFCVYRQFTRADISAEARRAARATLGVPDDEAMIVTLGIVDAVKSPAVCVDAVAELVQRGIPARLHFVGECSNHAREALEQQARAAGIGGRLAFAAGWLDEDGYRRFVVAADAGVQLRTHFFGGLSGALMDCVAAGLPTVANQDLASAIEAPAYIARVPDRPSSAAVAEALAACLAKGSDRSRHDAAREAFAAAHGFDTYARSLLDAVLDRPEDRSVSAATPAREPAIGTVTGLPRVFVDASYTGSAAAHSGVARVVTRTSEAICDVAARRGAEAHRVAVKDGTFVALDAAGGPIRFSRGDILLLPDAYWVFPDVWPAVERARVAGATAVPVVYDLIPLKHPEIYGLDGARMLRRYL
ncbi:MAG: glycosyltransferase, partial [Planctomycetaceae bacterium]